LAKTNTGGIKIMASQNPQDVQQHLERVTKTQQGQLDQELIFNPSNGQLVVQTSGEYRNPDATPADQITRDGFFYKQQLLGGEIDV
jgi:hypothetical protein